jgi:chaperonin GroEL
VIAKAIEWPLRKIADNAGVEGSVVINKVKESDGAFGYNARTDVYEDLIEAGVIDPKKVVRFALQNAASVASVMLTTEAMIADKPEKDDGGGMGGGMPGGMGGGMGGGMPGMM